ncbi:NUDIX domain-containing protein [Jannaschia aquimarina]|uniref:RppH_1 protein n=1 Tax=Jannaschia aquimarina TaxID=935700 RepID=A0A0D1EJ62_9RHOB|nr:NUDIX domain-containing protein [Jannaschia aquimarina]KIT17016.1 RNA pyrophosphohydrolase [Jannaschia aquimarina]SNS81545.1 8-oxo-dGTP diphosphatase [Jannaschia aquimarina]
MIPRLGRPPPSVPHRFRPGAYAILVKGDRILLTEQDMPDGVELQLPGGGLEPEETTIPGLVREVIEETGYRCRILRRVGAYRRFTMMEDYGVRAEKLCHIYLGQAGLRIGPPREQGHRAIWAHRDEAIRGLANRADAEILHRVLRNRWTRR